MKHHFRSVRALQCRAIFACVLIGATAAPVVPANEATSRAARPSFVVILCDNLGYGDIEPFAATVHRTPRLSRMATEGRRFTHFYVSSGVCTPSRASLMTGCYSQRIGLHQTPRDGRVLRPVSPYGLAPREVTIAEVLRSSGYRTCLIGKWHLGDQPAFLPLGQGFEEFFGIPYSDDMTQEVGRRVAPRFDGDRWPPLPLMEQSSVAEAPADRNSLTRRYTERAIEFIKANQDRPFFLFLSHAMPGSTREPFASDAFRGRSENGPWGDAVEELDWSTGEVLDALDRLGLSESTLVIWTSDNGAPSNSTDERRGTNRPLFGRGYSTSEGAFRVPTLARWTGRVSEGTTCDQLATTMDLLPTFAQMGRAELTTNGPIDGRDITSLLCDESAVTPHEAFLYYQMDQLQAVRDSRFKLFLPLEDFERHPHFKKGQANGPLLFDLMSDIGCEQNVAADHPGVIKRLTKFADDARRLLGDKGVAGQEQRPVGYVENPVPVVAAQ